MPPEDIMNWSMNQILEWRAANQKRLSANLQRGGSLQKQIQRWSRPHVGNLKMNVDASVKKGHDSFSVGLVLRDHLGRYIEGKTRRFAGVVQVVEAETIAILEGLLWFEELPATNITLESDSFLNVRAINKPNLNYLELGSLVQQCKNIIRGRSEVSLVHVRKQANKAAHRSARFPCELNSFVVNLSSILMMLETLGSDALLN